MADLYQIDSHKMIYHPDRAAAIKAAGRDWDKAKHIYPVFVELAPIGACNHRCQFCCVDYIGYKPDRLSIEMMRERLPELARLGVRSLHFAGEGEPMLHKNISEMIRLTKESGMDASLTTNASIMPTDFLDDALPHLSWIKVSMNAGTAETYASLHGTKPEDFHKAQANLTAMAERRRAKQLDCALGAQILLLPENADELETLVKTARDQMGVDYVVVKSYSHHLSSETTKYKDMDYAAYLHLEKDLAKYNTDRFNVVFRSNTMRKLAGAHGYDRCHSVPFVWAYIMANGTVSGCSAYLLNEKFEYGNVNDQSFEQIWTGAKRQASFDYVMNELDISDCRKNCRMDEVNRYLYALIDNPPPHVNFI